MAEEKSILIKWAASNSFVLWISFMFVDCIVFDLLHMQWSSGHMVVTNSN